MRTPLVTTELAPALLHRLRWADRVRLPIRWLARTSAMSADPRVVRIVRRDPLGGGNRVGLRFLRTWMGSRRVAAPERFTACPVLLAHPAADTWTRPEHSLRFLARVAAPTETVMLENAGHLPIEQPGVDQLHDVLHRTLDGLGRST